MDFSQSAKGITRCQKSGLPNRELPADMHSVIWVDRFLLITATCMDTIKIRIPSFPRIREFFFFQLVRNIPDQTGDLKGIAVLEDIGGHPGIAGTGRMDLR
jgi:hypothetical protein